MRRCDVLIVGAGLAGLWTARQLAGSGLRVLLVDGRPRVDRQIRTTGIFVRRTLEDFALPEDCLGPAVRRVVLYSPGRKALPLESPHPEFRVGRMGPLYRRLLAEARAAGAEWRSRTRCVGFAWDEGGRLARLTGAGAGLVRPRFVIGADGARSRVAGWLGLDRNREWIAGVEEVYTGVPLEGPPVFHCVLSPDLAPGYLAWLVHDGEEVHLGVGGYAERFDPNAALAAFRANPPVPLDLAAGRLVERRGGLIPVGGVLARIASPHGLLVGDAAGAVSPLTAGGLDPCLRLSDFAARVTLDYLESGDPAALQPYNGARFRRRFTSRLLLRRLLARLEHPVLLEFGLAFLRRPPLDRVAHRIFFGRGSFPDVPRFPEGRLYRAAAAPAPAAEASITSSWSPA
jgi:flavin-dependent dehydrogenase